MFGLWSGCPGYNNIWALTPLFFRFQTGFTVYNNSNTLYKRIVTWLLKLVCLFIFCASTAFRIANAFGPKRFALTFGACVPQNTSFRPLISSVVTTAVLSDSVTSQWWHLKQLLWMMTSISKATLSTEYTRFWQRMQIPPRFLIRSTPSKNRPIETLSARCDVYTYNTFRSCHIFSFAVQRITKKCAKGVSKH